jgi:hypothetical protein
MTAALSPQLAESYERADIKDLFFSSDEIRKINNFADREQAPLGDPKSSCNTNLFFGFFFDGTRNNYVKANATKAHSNIARLYDCFPGESVPGVLPEDTDWKHNASSYNNFFRVYVPGVASPFKQVNDSGEGFFDATLGGGAGRQSNERIVWALVQAINNVNRFFNKSDLISSDEATAIATRLELSKEARHEMRRVGQPDDEKNNLIKAPRIEFEKLLLRLHASVSQHWKKPGCSVPPKKDPGIVGTIFISMFGFSRGAAKARAFANWLDSLCQLDAEIRGECGLSLGGFPVVFDFLGVFDTVASVGRAATFADLKIVNLKLLANAHGHDGWADAEDSLRVPASVKSCVHLVAAHDLRRSFPLDSVAVDFSIPVQAEEIVFPGVHSDVGGGYMPKEQGKGTDPDGVDMLSRLPLLYMYKQARLAGVPLKLELAEDVVKKRFAITPKTIMDFNAYLNACTLKTGSITDIMREQAILQMTWRYVRRSDGQTPLRQMPNFLRASTFDQNDLDSSNEEFDQELRDFRQWLADRSDQIAVKQEPGFKGSADLEWEELKGHWPLLVPSESVLQFFDEYVHDSRAAFKLSGPDNEVDALALVRKWSKQLKFAKQRYARNARSDDFEGPPDYGLPTNARMAAEDYDLLQALPRYVVEGREPYGRARAGYFRFRRIYGGSDKRLLSNWRPEHKERQMHASTQDAPASTANSSPRAA